jgi:hypothetical protein
VSLLDALAHANAMRARRSGPDKINEQVAGGNRVGLADVRDDSRHESLHLLTRQFGLYSLSCLT